MTLLFFMSVLRLNYKNVDDSVTACLPFRKPFVCPGSQTLAYNTVSCIYQQSQSLDLYCVCLIRKIKYF